MTCVPVRAPARWLSLLFFTVGLGFAQKPIQPVAAEPARQEAAPTGASDSAGNPASPSTDSSKAGAAKGSAASPESASPASGTTPADASAPTPTAPAGTSAPAGTPTPATNATPTNATPANTAPANAAQANAAQANAAQANATPATQSVAALRNENIFASKLDTDAEKLDNQRLGGSYVLVMRPVVESKNFATEYGQSPSALSVLRRQPLTNQWHGDLFESLQNSVFNARTFFQVGPVLPSRMNSYGTRFSGPLPRWGALSGSFAQVKNRGMVNGNVLVPLPSERTPLTTDPATRAMVERFLAAYPDIAPNRPDFDPHALNTNSPQTTNLLNANLRFDGKVGNKGTLSLFHSINRQTINAFELVAGQNPDTSIHSQESRLTYRLAAGESTELDFGAGYQRLRSDLHPEPNAVGPRVSFGNAIEPLGPLDQYPLNRAENTFRYGLLGYHQPAGSRHRFTFGGDLIRYQLNGMEQNGVRGDFGFSANFGRSAIENLLWGTPTTYQVRIGEFVRGFRTWTSNLFFADQWTVTPRFQMYIGVRHSLTTAPTEVNNLNQLPYHTDWNNFSPVFSFAYRGLGDWVARGSYTISFGQIYPVTYSQDRYNGPNTLTLRILNPSLTDPLAGIDLGAADVRSSLTAFSPDLATPYSHQYNFRLERSFGPATISLGYVGSRTIKMLNFFQLNRAVNVPGVPLTTGTVNDRRPDPNYYDVFQIVNAGIAYLDAAQVSWRMRTFAGFTGGATYTFGKALDQGSMYNSTAANNDLNSRSQYQYNMLNDRKGLSSFDSPHSLVVYGTYQLPGLRGLSNPLAALARNWQISGTMMAKSGTPFTVGIGSDAPGFGNVDGSGGDRPDIVNPSILGATLGDPATSTLILNPANFRYLTPGETAGNLGHNTFRREAIFNINGSVSRDWKWNRGSRTYLLRLQGDAYNLGNHAQFDKPQSTLTAPSFGKITNTLNNGRVLQFGIRLGF